jgi:hypothetical protein
MQKQKRKSKPATTSADDLQTDPSQEGLPNPESVIDEKVFVSPKGSKYVILKTTEIDPTDKPKRKGKA